MQELEASYERLAGSLAKLYTRPGYPFEKEDPELHRVTFDWLLKRGQWVMVAKDSMLLGWQGWFRCDAPTLEILRNTGILEAARRGLGLVLDSGPYCYVSGTVIPPGVPRGMYKELFRLTAARNSDAAGFAAHLTSRRGRTSWWFMSKEGSPA